MVVKLDLVVVREGLPVPPDCGRAATDPDLALLGLDEGDHSLGDDGPNVDPVLVGVVRVGVEIFYFVLESQIMTS